MTCEAMLSGPCTMVQEEAYGRPNGGELAPETGTIKTIRVIAGGPGSFRPQVATVKHSASTLLGATKARVTYTGPKGQQLALRGNIGSMICCSSGGTTPGCSPRP
jgi:hypothetical protein